MQRYDVLSIHANLFNEPVGFFNEMALGQINPRAISLILLLLLFTSDEADGLFNCCGIRCTFTASAGVIIVIVPRVIITVTVPIGRRGVVKFEVDVISVVIERANETIVVQTVVGDSQRCALLAEVDIDDAIVNFPRNMVGNVIPRSVAIIVYPSSRTTGQAIGVTFECNYSVSGVVGTAIIGG